MVMTFVLHPLSHYDTITEPRTQFFLSLIEGLIIDFPSHFILSLIDVFRDTMTRDKLIFPFSIMRLLHHFSVSYLESSHFSFICAIDIAIVKWSFAQLHSSQPQSQMAAPLAFTAPSTSTSPTSMGGVTLDVIMVQL